MLLHHGTLSLSHTLADEDEIILVSSIQWITVRAEGGYREADNHKALWMLENLDRHRCMEMRSFAAQLGRFDLYRMDDREVLKLIRDAIRDGRVIAVQKGAEESETPGATVQLRRLLAQVEKQIRGKLSYRGRQYKLVVDVDLAQLPDRDYYEVAPQTEARAVLDSAAKDLGAPADLLKQASDKLSKDWRPPFSQPEGLVLLRRIPARASTHKDVGPALTPSQIRAMMEAEKPVAFFARFADEHGKGLSGITGTLAHGSDPDNDMAFPSAGFAKVALKGEKQAWLTLPDDATKTLVDVLKNRWQEIRGEVDEAWKAKEEALVEVLFQKGKVTELQLEAEKKYTFMLRPPVALAHMHGMYFDTNKCFLLPSAVASLKRLPEIYELHPDSEVLIVGHTDTAGSASYNLDLSADRADAMRAYLRNDADAWLAWYESGVREGKRWGDHEDSLMIDALVPDDEFSGKSHVEAFQAWHNDDTEDARQPGQERNRPDGWEALKVDGKMGPKTRRQLVLDTMNLDGTTLPDDVRVVTYGCGEQFPLVSEKGDIDTSPTDGEDVPFDRRIELFFFAKPFGILPRVPGVADGESPKDAIEATKSDRQYPEWRVRTTHRYAIEAETDGFRLRLCDYDLIPYAERPFAFCLAGYPEVRGTTDKGGFVIVDSPPASSKGHIELWPDDEMPENKVIWEIDVGAIISAGTPKGAATRLANLDYFDEEPTDEMTDDLREAITSFQTDSEDLDINGELDDATSARLRCQHDCEADEADAPDSEDSENGEAATKPEPTRGNA